MSNIKNIQSITNHVVLPGRRNNRAWFAPTMAVAPGMGRDGGLRVLASAAMLTGMDIGVGFWLHTDDLGETWTPPKMSMGLLANPVDLDVKNRQAERFQSLFGRSVKFSAEHDIFECPAVGIYRHAATDTLLGLGGTYFTADRGDDPHQKNLEHIACFDRSLIYAIWDRHTGDFQPWRQVAPPATEPGHRFSFVGGSQWCECDDGSILMPASHLHPPTPGASSYPDITVVRCRFDGETFHCLEHGNFLGVESQRGLAEPSLTRFQSTYFLTIRHDERAYVAISEDGLHYQEPRPWTFDDGSDLGNYNTQQHWLCRADSLWLVYNRRSELNNGVVRSRAPLFIARVDPERLCVLRDTERIVFPEKGARMGNFAVANVTEDESWILTGEWLQQYISGYEQGMPFWADGGDQYNRMQYIGDLLLAKVRFA